MTHTLTATCLLLIGFVATGCKQEESPTSMKPAVSDKSSTRSADVDLAVLRYDTGDVKNWPDYQLPLEHSFETIEPPPEVIGPFSAADIPAEE